MSWPESNLIPSSGTKPNFVDSFIFYFFLGILLCWLYEAFDIIILEYETSRLIICFFSLGRVHDFLCYFVFKCEVRLICTCVWHTGTHTHSDNCIKPSVNHTFWEGRNQIKNLPRKTHVRKSEAWLLVEANRTGCAIMDIRRVQKGYSWSKVLELERIFSKTSFLPWWQTIFFLENRNSFQPLCVTYNQHTHSLISYIN